MNFVRVFLFRQYLCVVYTKFIQQFFDQKNLHKWLILKIPLHMSFIALISMPKKY